MHEAAYSYFLMLKYVNKIALIRTICVEFEKITHVNTNTMCPQNVASLRPPQWKGDVRSSRIGALLQALVAEKYVALGHNVRLRSCPCP